MDGNKQKEISLIAVGAGIYQCDTKEESWVPIDSGLSRIDIYSRGGYSFRIVGVDIKTSHYSLHINILPNLVYQKITDIFHQFTHIQSNGVGQSSSASFGLNFRTPVEAEQFKEKLDECKLKISGAPYSPSSRSPPVNYRYAASPDQANEEEPEYVGTTKSPPQHPPPAVPRAALKTLDTPGLKTNNQRVEKHRPMVIDRKAFVTPEDLDLFKREVFAYIDQAKAEILTVLLNEQNIIYK